MQNEASNQEEVDAQKRSKLIAIVQRHSVNEQDQGLAEFIIATSKKDMVLKLSDPSIKQVLGLLRGKRLEFTESRKVSF